jgi:hypothetical protein
MKQQELKNSESEDDGMFYLFSIILNSLFTVLYSRCHVGQLGISLVRTTYDNDANSFIHLHYSLLQFAVSFYRGNRQNMFTKQTA